MKWNKSESELNPKLLEYLADGRVLVRKNVKEVMNEDGLRYCYDERLMTSIEYAVYEAAHDVAIKREAEIIDEFTMKLIEEGVI